MNDYHHYILVSNPQAPLVAAFIDQHQLPYEVHLNRIRFWLPPGDLYLEFLLRYADSCPIVDPGF